MFGLMRICLEGRGRYGNIQLKIILSIRTKEIDEVRSSDVVEKRPRCFDGQYVEPAMAAGVCVDLTRWTDTLCSRRQ